MPTGTVTFLFTDIEGSTRLLGQHPIDYPIALTRHDEILRTAVAAYGGIVFETVGDAFYADFARPSACVAADVHAQRELHATDWGALASLRARMAVHTGEAELRGDHYFSPALYR